MSARPPGFSIVLEDGVYGNSAAGGTGLESYPLVPTSNVGIFAAQGATPVLDVENPSTGSSDCLLVPSGLTISVSGITIVNCARAIYGDGQGAALSVSSCTFSAFTDIAIDVTFRGASSGASNDLQVLGAMFLGNGASAALRIRTMDGCSLIGSMRSSEILGGVQRGVSIDAHDTSRVDGAIMDNLLVGCEQSGILLRTFGAGGSLQDPATISSPVIGNTLQGPGVGFPNSVGLEVRAEALSPGDAALVDSVIRFNLVEDHGFGMVFRTSNSGGESTSISCPLFGNRVLDNVVGVRVVAAGANLGLPDNAPILGSDSAGANTFAGNTTDFSATGVVGTIQARWNFFPAGAALIGTGSWDAGEVLSEILAFELPQTLPGETYIWNALLEREHVWVRFVDNNYTSSGAEQATVELDGQQIQSFWVSIPGDAMSVSLPAMAEGIHELRVTNPGGQTGVATLTVGPPPPPGSGGLGNSGSWFGSGAGCFVATAAFGDQDSAEVVHLRRLRDDYLQTSAAGRSFIGWYYRNGPAAAAWIAPRPWARFGSRIALVGPVVSAAALTTWNAGARFAFAVLMTGLLFSLTKRP